MPPMPRKPPSLAASAMRWLTWRSHPLNATASLGAFASTSAETCRRVSIHFCLISAGLLAMNCALKSSRAMIFRPLPSCCPYRRVSGAIASRGVRSPSAPPPRDISRLTRDAPACGFDSYFRRSIRASSNHVARSLPPEDKCSPFSVLGGALSKLINYEHSCAPDHAVVAQPLITSHSRIVLSCEPEASRPSCT